MEAALQQAGPAGAGNGGKDERTSRFADVNTLAARCGRVQMRPEQMGPRRFILQHSQFQKYCKMQGELDFAPKIGRPRGCQGSPALQVQCVRSATRQKGRNLEKKQLSAPEHLCGVPLLPCGDTKDAPLCCEPCVATHGGPQTAATIAPRCLQIMQRTDYMPRPETL